VPAGEYVTGWNINSSPYPSSSSARPERPSDEGQVRHVQQPNPGPSNPEYGSSRYWSLKFLDPKLVDAYLSLKTWNLAISKSSGVHASSSSAPSRSDHGPTNVVQVPAPNPASSTANPNPLIRPPGPSSTALMQGSCEDCLITMHHGMTYFRIKTTMSCMGRSTPQCRQDMARAMD
jgi:hypothetical protein